MGTSHTERDSVEADKIRRKPNNNNGNNSNTENHQNQGMTKITIIIIIIIIILIMGREAQGMQTQNTAKLHA